MTEQFLGEIRVFAMPTPPPGWRPCDGTLLPINDYQALFSILGNVYGGNGVTNFALPDFRGRFGMGANGRDILAGSVQPQINAGAPQATVNADNSQPYLALCYAIAVNGIYPARE